jgi:hypothetical protein
VHPLRQVAHYFWAPVPWMLEAMVALQIAIGEHLEALARPDIIVASSGDMAVVSCFAAAGILMSKLPLPIIGLLFLATICFAVGLDAVMRAVFGQLRID